MPRVPRKATEVKGLEGLPAEQQRQIQEEAHQLRMHGRPEGELYEKVGKQFRESGQGWPYTLLDEKLGTVTVPMTFQGLCALITKWDCELLDEEVVTLNKVVRMVMPMPLPAQNEERERRGAIKAEFDHMKAEHPQEFERMQGWRV